MAGKPIPAEQRFWPKVNKSGGFPDFSDPLVRLTIEDGQCWIWLGGKTTQGYGNFRENGKPILAHRYSFKLHGFKLGEQTDHLCRRRMCVNPNHLEAVTIRENTLGGLGKASRALRENKCHRGHELSGENVRIEPCRGGRVCRTCARDYAREWNRKRKELKNG